MAHHSSEDSAWAHARAVPNAKNNTICLHCNKLIKRVVLLDLSIILLGLGVKLNHVKRFHLILGFK